MKISRIIPALKTIKRKYGDIDIQVIAYDKTFDVSRYCQILQLRVAVDEETGQAVLYVDSQYERK